MSFREARSLLNGQVPEDLHLPQFRRRTMGNRRAEGAGIPPILPILPLVLAPEILATGEWPVNDTPQNPLPDRAIRLSPPRDTQREKARSVRKGKQVVRKVRIPRKERKPRAPRMRNQVSMKSYTPTYPLFSEGKGSRAQCPTG